MFDSFLMHIYFKFAHVKNLWLAIINQFKDHQILIIPLYNQYPKFFTCFFPSSNNKNEKTIYELWVILKNEFSQKIKASHFFFKLFSSTIIQRKFQIEIKFKKQSSKMKYIF